MSERELAVLASHASASLIGPVTEWEDGDQLEAVRYAEQFLDLAVLLGDTESDEAGSESLFPADELHLLEGATGVEVGPVGVVHSDCDSHRRVGDEPSAGGNASYLSQCVRCP